MDKEQTTLYIQGKTIYIVKASGGWSLIIMEDEIVLDNYHNKGGYIHPNPKQHKKEIKIKHDIQEENLNLIIQHLNKNKKLILNQLIEELKQ
ncbi:MAG: hypothetical protein LBM26_01775 [Methanobrevibacter sp.]|jgi:hypothetical protein|nr:hypothetical protein [Methanobrevibacter sp.]